MCEPEARSFPGLMNRQRRRSRRGLDVGKELCALAERRGQTTLGTPSKSNTSATVDTGIMPAASSS